MRHDADSVVSCLRSLDRLQQQNHLPAYDEVYLWATHTIRGKDFGAHESVAITQDNVRYTTLELGFEDFDEDSYLYPAVRPYTGTLEKLPKRGTVRTSLRCIFKLVLL